MDLDFSQNNQNSLQGICHQQLHLLRSPYGPREYRLGTAYPLICLTIQAVMASLSTILDKAFKIIKKSGSQISERTLASVCDALHEPLQQYHFSQPPYTAGKAMWPMARDLLHTAGWLYPWIMPSSSLSKEGRIIVQSTWCWCLFMVETILQRTPLTDQAGFLLLCEPNSRLRIPGGP